MQVKTINKIIRDKMNEWLESITDESLRKEVRESLLVSGGCIANMFLRDEVNDFDIYLQDMDVLRKLVEYYCKPKSIGFLDGRERDDYIKDYCYEKYGGDSDEKRAQFEKDHSINAVIHRTLKPGQIKIYLTDGGLSYEPEGEDKYQVVFLSPNAITLSDKIQIVCRFSGTPEQIHANYDFIHATNYFTMKDGVVTNNDALVSLITKQLKYQGSLYPITSVIRIKKFTARGFNITAGEILKILYQVSQLDLTNPDIMEEQLIGVDIAYFNALIRALQKSTPEQRSSADYLFSMIDKIFG